MSDYLSMIYTIPVELTHQTHKPYNVSTFTIGHALKTLISTQGIGQVCQSVVEILITAKLDISEGEFSASEQCAEEVRALVSVASEGEVAICNMCLSV